MLKKMGDGVINFAVLRVKPELEHNGINAVLVNSILCDNNDFINNGGYICDGARNINHETNFQGYLEKYFGFRKAYCKLHIKYRFPFNIAVKILLPFRKIFYKNSKKRGLHNIAAVLKMEEIISSK